MMVHYDFEQIKKDLERKLSPARFQHTLGVIETAERLANQYGEDTDKACMAALLHDCAKCIPNSKKLKLCQEHNIPVSDIEKKSPYLLHSRLGAYIAKEKYGIEDEEILDAIACHTTGKPDMTMLDIIIYMADYIEPNRDKAPNLKEIRKLCFENIEEALYEVLKSTLDYLEDRPEAIDPMTKESYLFYKWKLKK